MMYTYRTRTARPEMMMNRMLRDFCGMPERDRRLPMGFPVDVRKEEAGYILTAELPGVSMNDITLTIEDDVLTIAADLSGKAEEKAEYLIRERSGGHVERTFMLEGIDQSAVTAVARDGLLIVTLPKEAPAEGKGPRRIAIAGAAPAPARLEAAE